MFSSPNTSARQVIPRWRPLDRTIASYELGSPKFEAYSPSGLPAELVKRLARWRFEQGVVHAAELVESAISLGREEEALGAARSLLRGWSGATSLVLKQAALLLKRHGSAAEVTDQRLLQRADLSSRRPRESIELNAADALAWVELALAQTSCGHLEQAERSMRVALQLAPHNRHVLRSAARLFVQLHDVERAHSLIRKAERTPHDPWLIAAEIALAGEAGRHPSFIKVGRLVLDEARHRPRQISELASALASDELGGGNTKRAKKLFRASLFDPTGNSLAQADWASTRLGVNLIGSQQLDASSDAAEARARKAFDDGDFESCLEHARSWIVEEPYSAVAHFSGSLTANVIEDYGTSAQLARQGLQRDPKSGLLRSNLVLALGSLGRLDEAERELRVTMSLPLTGESSAVCTANEGLIAMRRGNLERGRERYRSAIADFRRRQSFVSERLALTYFAREAAVAGLPDAQEILTEAEGLHPTYSTPQLVRAFANTRRLIKERAECAGVIAS